MGGRGGHPIPRHNFRMQDDNNSLNLEPTLMECGVVGMGSGNGCGVGHLHPPALNMRP